MKDCYRILRVPRDAEATTIKAAYRRLALRYHPDVARTPGARERFIEIPKAAQVLAVDLLGIRIAARLETLDVVGRRSHGGRGRQGSRRLRKGRSKAR